MAVSADITNGEVDAFLYDHFIAAYIRQTYLIRIFECAGAMVFVLYGIYEYFIRLVRKGDKAQLGVVEIAMDEMELYQYFLTQEFGAIEKDLVFLEVVDILQLERRHACPPDDSSGCSAERYILRCDDRIGQIRGDMLL
jgi:hypothetical protein